MNIISMSPVVGKKTCATCDCEFEYDKSDILSTINDIRTNKKGVSWFSSLVQEDVDRYFVSFVRCPKCRMFIVLEREFRERFKVEYLDDDAHYGEYRVS